MGSLEHPILESVELNKYLFQFYFRMHLVTELRKYKSRYVNYLNIESHNTSWDI